MSPERTRERPRVHPRQGGPSRTKQSYQDQCDVNIIVKQFSGNGLFTHTAKTIPRYADVSESGDLLQAYQAVEAAAEEFGDLPAEVRAVAENNPVRFLQMLEDPQQRAELMEAGLVDQVTPVAPVEVTFVPGGEPPVAAVTEPS